MATMTSRTREPIVPTAQDAAIAREASRMPPYIDHLENPDSKSGRKPLKLTPASAIRLLLDL